MKLSTGTFNIRKRIIKIISAMCIIVLNVSLIMPFFSKVEANAKDVDINKILFIGDSITYGLNNEKNFKYCLATVGDSPISCYNRIDKTNKKYDNIGCTSCFNRCSHLFSDCNKSIES